MHHRLILNHQQMLHTLAGCAPMTPHITTSVFSSFFFAYKLGKTIFKRFIGKRLVRTHSVLGWLRVINDSQPKQISPPSRRASAHISSTRHAAILPLVMFLLDFSPSSSLRLRLQGIAPLFSLSSFHHSE